jgi:tRNA 2-thiouridine synthesizing protein A
MTGAEETPTLRLDCRGQRCPLPVIRLAREIGRIEVGAIIAVAADDPAAAADVPAWCRMQGQDFLGSVPDPDGIPVYAVRRTR